MEQPRPRTFPESKSQNPSRTPALAVAGRAGVPLPASRTQPREAGEHFPPNTASGAAPLHGWRTEREQTGAPSALPTDPADPGAVAKVAHGGQGQDATVRIPPCPTARGSVPGAGLDPSASNPATSPVGAGRSPAGVVPPAISAVERLTRLLHEAERRRDGLLAGLRAEEQEIATLQLERDAVMAACETQRAVREELTGGDALARAIVEDAEASRGGAS